MTRGRRRGTAALELPTPAEPIKRVMDQERRDASWERVEARLDSALQGARDLAAFEAKSAAARARRLESELHQQRRRASTLLRIGRAINAVRGLPALLQLIVDLAVDACGAERGLVVIPDPDAERPELSAAANLNLEHLDRPDLAACRAVVDRVCRDGVEVVTSDADGELDLGAFGDVHQLHPVSVICVPITSRDGIIGAIYVDARRLPDSKFHHDPDLLSTIADQAAVAIENARLYADLSRSFTRLSALKAQTDEILEAISSGVVVLDARDVITNFNRAAETTFGVPASTLIGREARLLNTWLPGLSGLIERTKASADQRWQFERSGTNLTRGPIAVRITIFGLHDFLSSEPGTAIVINDVTESRALYVERRQNVEKRERIAKSLERYLAPQVVRELINDPEGPELANTRLIATTLFADIGDFTELAARLDPVEVVKLLNRYLDPLVNVVFDYGGMLDKFYGDGIMAVFGTPHPAADDALRAVRAAVQMVEQVKMLNLSTGAVRPLSISIGLATGEIVAGHIGTQRRLEYTVIGDAVNLAARLEGLAEPNQILADERTYDKIRGAVAATRRLVRIKGKSGTAAVYVLHG